MSDDTKAVAIMSQAEVREMRILLTLLAENLPRMVCKYYQGDEWDCLRGNVCTCNCDGRIEKCEFLAEYNMPKFLSSAEVEKSAR